MDLHPLATVSPSSLVTALAADHSGIDHLLADVERTVGDREWERADDTLRELAERLGRHMRAEEEVLFPIYEARAWRLARATAVMRQEHRAILAALAQMKSAVAREDGDAFRAGYVLLHDVLPGHHVKEEHVLYAAIDQVLSEGERTELLAHLRGRP